MNLIQTKRQLPQLLARLLYFHVIDIYNKKLPCSVANFESRITAISGTYLTTGTIERRIKCAKNCRCERQNSNDPRVRRCGKCDAPSDCCQRSNRNVQQKIDSAPYACMRELNISGEVCITLNSCHLFGNDSSATSHLLRLPSIFPGHEVRLPGRSSRWPLMPR